MADEAHQLIAGAGVDDAGDAIGGCGGEASAIGTEDGGGNAGIEEGKDGCASAGERVEVVPLPSAERFGAAVEESAAGSAASDALAAGVSRAALLMAILAGLGIAIALLMGRHELARPRAVELAAAATGALSHTIPTQPTTISNARSDG